ncbi:hypothetical protein WEN_03335 [Mycoplasma wenyonii str. Massachusetts]|uniref:Uncharacterized protein n=1 Tax=Mycoplasma wenyonii (strain Massachusetts) TaxID=1197325 RepID=I6YMA5_MYCWM|nr:hypothetical protein [Mycoplasma wenyonii]AFN65444.1 hypothetical protein WEN_03335 [Mycoplasma wenyonii str. Massachusetts]
MPLPALGKGLIILGSAISPSLFSLLQLKQQSRLVETVGEVSGKLWNEVKVGPWFDSWRMREGAGAGNMAYSYGYVLRMSGSENASIEKRTITNETNDTKVPMSGALTLIETKLSPRKGWLVNKNSIEPVIGGYTNKKFLLIGIGNTSNEIEFQGLVSIVKDGGPSNAKCWKEFKDTSVQAEIKKQFNGSGLLLSGTYDGQYSKQGRALIGNCSKEFYKNKNTSEIPVIEELKGGESGSRIGLQELNINGGMSIAVAVGLKEKGWYKREIIAPGILVKNQFNDGKTLWVGLQGDGKAKMRDHAKSYRMPGQGWVAIHDWKSTKAEENLKVGKETGKVKKITLGEGRKYYLWDPSYTRIEKGELITKDGKKIPWKFDIKFPFTSKLIK